MSVSQVLTVRNLSIEFGGVRAVEDVSFDVQPGEVFAIIGPNGAGKSTIFNLISRLYEPTARRRLSFPDGFFGKVFHNGLSSAGDR